MTSLRASAVLLDGFARVRDTLHSVVAGLGPEALNWRPEPDANSIAWLGWHLARVQDDHQAGISDGDQVWLTGWSERFALPVEPRSIGFGQTAAQAQSIVVDSGDLLTGYYDDVSQRTVQVISALTDADYDRIVDERWDPPVTLAVRVVSMLNDVTQHVGQAAYLKGLLP